MITMTKKLDFLANLALITASIVFVASAVRTYWWPDQPAGVKPGMRLALPGDSGARATRSLVFVLQTDCHFCTESAPFYRRLTTAARGKDVHLVAALPQTVADSRRYLQGLEIPIDDVRQVPPGSLRVSGTPTLIAVDEQGVVKTVWRGRLPPEREAEVLASLQGGS